VDQVIGYILLNQLTPLVGKNAAFVLVLSGNARRLLHGLASCGNADTQAANSTADVGHVSPCIKLAASERSDHFIAAKSLTSPSSRALIRLAPLLLNDAYVKGPVDMAGTERYPEWPLFELRNRVQCYSL
jgi:hypothetical protein